MQTTVERGDAIALERLFKHIVNERTTESTHIFADIFHILSNDTTTDGIKLHHMTHVLNHDGRNLAVVDVIGYLAALQRAHLIKLIALDESNEPHIRMLKHDRCQA